MNIGPNTVTFVLSAISFTTKSRMTSAGICNGVGKLGGLVGILFVQFNPLLNYICKFFIAIAGIVITYYFFGR